MCDVYLGSLGIKISVLETFDSELSVRYSNGDVKLEPEYWSLEASEEI